MSTCELDGLQTEGRTCESCDVAIRLIVEGTEDQDTWELLQMKRRAWVRYLQINNRYNKGIETMSIGFDVAEAKALAEACVKLPTVAEIIDKVEALRLKAEAAA